MRRMPAVLVVALASAAVLAGCSGPTDAEDQAHDLIAFGGPPGWTATPQDALDQPLPDNDRAEVVDSVPVTFEAGDQPDGVKITWISPVDAGSAAQRCAELVAWLDHAEREWPTDAAIDVDGLEKSCADHAADPTSSILDAAAGTAHGAHGRVAYGAMVGGKSGTLTATLEYNADV
ncbi:hypothetical protein [Cellulomonas rhizosphaerae]|uniref:Uncharacterized protein n=1 Tax=Cellulomonas rhizosphaerae TaxID=2293719 RepID=A0A413RR61_9CELL|nr:hypothetical protein [Cellulomonas rhizosphaerae]RHA44401.1 hypothetical protein D1825_01440 [Cellulomonas rhizosphaerae]